MIYLNIENNTEKDITFGLSSTGALTLYIVNEKKGLYDREKVDDASHITVSAGTTLHLSLPLAEEQEITLRGVNQLGVGKILTWDTSITDDGTGITYTSQEGQDTDEIRYNQTEYTGTHVYNSASCTHTLARGQVDSTGSGEYEITEKLLFNSKGLTVIFDDKNADYALVLDDNYPGGTTQEYDFSAEEIAPENSVPKTKELPGSSTRMGYQLLGWAYDPNATEPDFSATKPSTDAPWTITDLQAFFTDNPNAIPNGAWPKENGAATTVATLYAVWDVNDEARFVYIYKNVPLPGNRNTEFSFTFTLTGKYRATDKDDQDVSASGAFQLKHGEYAVLESEEHTDTALIQTKITVYNADGTKKSVNTPAEWQGTPYAGGGFEELLFTVTEASETYYDTTVTRTAQTAANPITLEGTRIADEADPDDPNTDPETHSTNTVHWNRTDAGGTLVFTNTRQTFNITLEKTEHSNTTVPGTFSFTAKYTLDGDTANVYTVSDIQVTSGTPNTNGLEDTPVGLFGMPAGADLTITEVNDGSYITKVKVDDGSWQENTTSVDLTVDAHKTVYFDNTLKSYHVDFKKVDQALQPTVNALFNLTGPAAFSRVNLYAKSGDGVFYKHDTDGDLWVGSYTLTETSVSEGYVGLSTPVTITLNGDAAEGSNVTCSDQNVLIQYDSATQVYTVYVINQRMVRYTVEKELVDALIPKRDFKFSYSYTADYDYTINGEEVHRNLSGSGTKTFMSGEANWSFDAPVGAALTITEEDYEGSKSNYDVTYKVGSGSYVNGNENYSYTMTVPDTPQTTVTFRNTRKTQDVTVKKLTVPDTDTTTSFGFTATLSLNVGGAAIDYDSNGFTDGVRTFNLTNTQTQVLKIPAGATIEVKELGSASYEPVSIESAEYADSDSNKASFTVRNVGKPGTITFTNRKVVSVTVKKTLVDALKPDQTFRFSASYVIDGKTTAMPVFNLGHNGEEVLSVPSGSKLTITETVDSSIYDTTVNGSPAQSYVIESATEDVTVVFANTRKTVKLIINNALEDTWNPTTVFNYTVSAAETGNSGNTMALDPADSSFSLPHGGTKEIILPVGTTVTVTEISTAAGDPALT